ncbi:MAG: hypothetical protein AAGP08_08390 [Pseudomonadota bacterium]
MTGLAALIGMACFGWLTLFQVMLAAGLPLGRLAWGGAHRVLPQRLRLSSAVSALLTLAGLVIVSQAGGYILVLPASWIVPGLWVYTAIFCLSFVANLFGATGEERLHGVAATSLCVMSTVILAVE